MYDTDALGDGFRRALSNSVLYQLISRCFGNPDDYLGFEDLSDVLDFNTPQTAIALGTAVSTISSEVLRQIEITVRSYDRNRERSQHYEKPTDLYPQRGLSDSGHQTGERGTAAPEQIRTDAPNLSEGPQSDAVQHPGSEPETLPASSGDSENRRAAIESDNGGASETESRTGQSHESDGLGTAHEQPESPGRGDDLRGVDLQLIADKPSDRGEQLSFFASEYEQIRMIDEAERVVATHSAFSMPQDYIDQFLRYGSNTENQRTQIVIEFSKQKPVEQLIPFLKKTYHGGYGMNFDGTKVSAWYSDEGMRIAYGSTARYARNAQVVTWEAVAGRIDVLLEQGQFATNAELAENRNFETKQLANQLWYMAHDMSKPAADAGYMDIVQSLPGGFPEGTERLTSLLSESYPFILEQVAAFRNAYLLDRSLMRFPMYNPQRMLHSLEEYHLPRREYTSTLTELPTEKPFITEDEINEHLTKGSGFSGSRDRIYTFYQVSHTGKEKQDFLKNEYGIGGGNNALSGNKPFEITEVGLFDVHLRDPSQAYPIFRVESMERLPALLRRDERNAHLFAAEVSEQPQPVTKPVVFYPADKTHLPYDIVIQTLHIPEPEHDPPAAEPAEPESPAMSEEEMLILEHEGQAALSEMGEFVPDPDGAISQAEPDEPPAHSPAVSIPIDGQWQDFPSAAAAEQAAYADFKATSHRNAQNFRITDDNLGVGGAKAKYQANINAIRLLKHLEAEGLQASPEQQEILSRYVGWGGLPDAFDESKQNWAAEFRELRELLTPEEYTAARASTLNAHYTSPTVIQAIYEAVGNMGFQTGNILEPSMGIGNFFGMLPEQMQGSRLYGVELDSITGRIAKQLYPKANITIAGFETTDRRDFFDLAVGNVPFGQYKVNDPAYNKLGFNIHNYFFAKALDQVRPGGVVAFVTSRYSMDAQNPSVRKYLAQRADLLGAIRLPKMRKDHTSL